MSKVALLGIFLGVVSSVFSQQQAGSDTSVAPINPRHLSPENAYARVYCILPLVGSGSLADPKRPMFAPRPPTPTAPLDRTGIITFQFQVSDDGNFALAECVAVKAAGRVRSTSEPTSPGTRSISGTTNSIRYGCSERRGCRAFPRPWPRISAALFVCLACASPAPRDTHFHVYAIVPLVGTGTADDPKRPIFVPNNGHPTEIPSATSFESHRGA